MPIIRTTLTLSQAFCDWIEYRALSKGIPAATTIRQAIAGEHTPLTPAQRRELAKLRKANKGARC